MSSPFASDPNADTWGWDPTTKPALTTRPLSPTAAPQAPGVPAYSGSGGTTVVSTQALTTFASNIDQFISPVMNANNAVTNLPPVAAGAFDRAWIISDAVTGGTGSKGTPLTTSFSQVLTDLAKGLGDLRDAANTMATTYTSTNALNDMNVADLQRVLDKPAGDFNGMFGGSGGG
jgi:hypothetical protein